jgi:hypothetical protein
MLAFSTSTCCSHSHRLLSRQIVLLELQWLRAIAELRSKRGSFIRHRHAMELVALMEMLVHESGVELEAVL